MALVEFYLGTVGPLYIDDTDPLYTTPTQVALKQDVTGATQLATTVVSETAFGQAAAVGTATTLAREDHTHGTPGLSLSSPLGLKSYTVATLPVGTQGHIAYVTDALAPTFLALIVGGGSVVTPVFYNGTNWVSF